MGMTELLNTHVGREILGGEVDPRTDRSIERLAPPLLFDSFAQVDMGPRSATSGY